MNEIHDLELILDLPNAKQRLEELKTFANELGALTSLNKVYRSGEYNEQQLVVAIYDAIVGRQHDARRNKHFLILALVGGGIGLFVIWSLPRAATHYFKLLQAKQDSSQTAYHGVDDNGKILRDENRQPVLFREMEGPYEEFYDDGRLHFVYIYHKGQIVEEKEFDRSGRLISYVKYDDKGNPILANF